MLYGRTKKVSVFQFGEKNELTEQARVKSKPAVSMKLTPSFSPDEVGFHHKVILSAAGGFSPSVRTDLVEKTADKSRRFFHVYIRNF